jgi:hypothetical protein
MPERKRGGQPGNHNAMKHGRYSAPLRAARLAAVRAAWKEKQRLSDEWIKTVAKTDYAAICERARAEKLGRRR